jgi:hypothetical protein
MNATETEQAGMQTAVGEDCMKPVSSSTRERLDSWKEIAVSAASSPTPYASSTSFASPACG